MVTLTWKVGLMPKLFAELAGFSKELAPAGAKVLVSSRVVANPDGKVRESKDRRVLTRNVVERVKETEEKFHRGDTTHDVSVFTIFFAGTEKRKYHVSIFTNQLYLK